MWIWRRIGIIRILVCAHVDAVGLLRARMAVGVLLTALQTSVVMNAVGTILDRRRLRLSIGRVLLLGMVLLHLAGGVQAACPRGARSHSMSLSLLPSAAVVGGRGKAVVDPARHERRSEGRGKEGRAGRVAIKGRSRAGVRGGYGSLTS